MGFAVSWVAIELISRHPTLAFQVAGMVGICHSVLLSWKF